MKKKYKPLMLKLDDLKKELKSRGLSTDRNKCDLTKGLQKEMKGLTRVPALCFTNPTKQLEDMNLEHYEIATVEPMHDISGNSHKILTLIIIIVWQINTGCLCIGIDRWFVIDIYIYLYIYIMVVTPYKSNWLTTVEG